MACGVPFVLSLAYLLLQPTLKKLQVKSLKKPWTHWSGMKMKVTISRSTLRSGCSCGVELRVLCVSVRPEAVCVCLCRVVLEPFRFV